MQAQGRHFSKVPIEAYIIVLRPVLQQLAQVLVRVEDFLRQRPLTHRLVGHDTWNYLMGEKDLELSARADGELVRFTLGAADACSEGNSLNVLCKLTSVSSTRTDVHKLVSNTIS